MPQPVMSKNINGSAADIRAVLLWQLKELEEVIQSGDLDESLRDIQDILYQLSGIRDDRILCLPKTESSSEVDPVFPLRVYTLGRFVVLKDTQPITFRTKAQKRPMDLLKTIIALGEKGVSKTVLIDLLWPDSHGDAALSALNSAVCRLRKLIGKEAIEINDGRVYLNRNYCWVDSWEFSKFLSCKKVNNETAPYMFSLGKELYLGNFLTDDEYGWFNSRRTKLRDEFICVYRKIAKNMVTENNYESAFEVIKKCIEINNKDETLYCELMDYQVQARQNSNALTTYRQCQDILVKQLGLTLSDKIQMLYLSIVKQ